MKARLIKIGNSQGIRIPKMLIEQLGLGEDVEIQVRDRSLVITPVTRARQGWAEAFQEMSEQGDDVLLDNDIATSWEDEDWEW